MKPAFVLTSPETGTSYSLYVDAPEAQAGPGPWPVILFLDGDDQFGPALTVYRELRATGAILPLLLVGVGYGATYRKPANRRGRDYTPTAHADEPGSGGGTAFLNFLTTTLWPELACRYPVDPTARGIAGHSLGSLLVLHALLQPKPFFSHHLASAPSIWWDDRSILRLAEMRYAADAVLPARLFLSVGEDDSESMTVDLDRLNTQLAVSPFAGLVTETRRFPDRNHFNVLPDAFGAGLRWLYPVQP